MFFIVMQCFPKTHADCGTKHHALARVSAEATRSSGLGEEVSGSLTGEARAVLRRAHELSSQ